MVTAPPHPKIALCLGLVLSIFPVIGLLKGIIVFSVIIRRSERPVMFWVAVLAWIILVGIIIISSVREILR